MTTKIFPVLNSGSDNSIIKLVEEFLLIKYEEEIYYGYLEQL